MNIFSRLFGQIAKGESDISRALKAVVERNDSDSRSQLQRVLQNQRLILPVKNEPGNLERDGNGRLLEDVQIDFIGSKDTTGQKFLAVFTNPEELQKWNPNLPKWIAVDTPSICRLAVSCGYTALKINPATVPHVRLEAKQIELLAGMNAGVAQ